MEHNELDVIYILDTPRWDKNWVKVLEEAEPVIFVSAPNYKFAGEKDIKEGKIAKLDVKDIDITMYRQVFYHANKYMTKEMEKFVEYCKF